MESAELYLWLLGIAVEAAAIVVIESYPAIRLWFVYDVSRSLVLLWILQVHPKNYGSAWQATSGLLTAFIGVAAYEAWSEQRRGWLMHMTLPESFTPLAVVGVMLAVCIGQTGWYGIWVGRVLVSLSIWLAFAVTWAHAAVTDAHGGSPPIHVIIFLCWATFDVVAYLGQLNGENRKVIGMLLTGGQLACFIAWGAAELYRRRKVILV